LLSKVPSFAHFNLFWAPLKSSPKIQGSIIFKENFYVAFWCGLQMLVEQGQIMFPVDVEPSLR
jgi:hypothetical protein